MRTNCEWLWFGAKDKNYNANNTLGKHNDVRIMLVRWLEDSRPLKLAEHQHPAFSAFARFSHSLHLADLYDFYRFVSVRCCFLLFSRHMDLVLTFDIATITVQWKEKTVSVITSIYCSLLPKKPCVTCKLGARLGKQAAIRGNERASRVSRPGGRNLLLAWMRRWQAEQRSNEGLAAVKEEEEEEEKAEDVIDREWRGQSIGESRRRGTQWEQDSDTTAGNRWSGRLFWAK